MNPQIKQRWVEALRSGEYKQGRCALRSVGPDGDEQFCCLGVLADLAARDGIDGWHPPEPGGELYRWRYGDDSFSWTGALPTVVSEWAGTSNSNTLVRVPDPPFRDQPVDLITLNDSLEWSFEQIADVIEEQL